MKRIYTLIVALAALSAVSCTQNRIEPSTQLKEDLPTFINAVYADSPGTKTVLQDDGTSVWWTADESINVFYGTEYSGRFTSTNTVPKALTTFSGTLTLTFVTGSAEVGNESKDFWAVYPYSDLNTCDGSSVTLTVPSEQEGKAGSFADKMLPAVAKGKTPDLVFYNVCGGVRFSVTQTGINKVVIKSNNGEPLSGKVKVAFNEEGKPYIQEVLDPVDSVIVRSPGDGFNVGSYFFAALLPQTLSGGLTISLKKDYSHAATSLSNSITVNHSRFGMLDEIDKTLVFENYPHIFFEDELVKSLCVSNWDTNGDGELSFAEAEAVTDIGTVFAGRIIERFEEFRYFKKVKTIEVGAFDSCRKLSRLTLPKSITTMKDNAFIGCSSLFDLAIPNSVTSLTDAVFRGSGLVSVTLPIALTVLNSDLFRDCANLKSVTIQNSVTTIRDRVFQGCTSLVEITIPENVTAVGSFAFADCSALKSITFLSTTPPSLGWDMNTGMVRVFENTNDCIVYVPSGCLGAYQSDYSWQRSYLDDRLKEIGN